jgi:hypothetical protein
MRADSALSSYAAAPTALTAHVVRAARRHGERDEPLNAARAVPDNLRTLTAAIDALAQGAELAGAPDDRAGWPGSRHEPAVRQVNRALLQISGTPLPRCRLRVSAPDVHAPWRGVHLRGTAHGQLVASSPLGLPTRPAAAGRSLRRVPYPICAAHGGCRART